MRRYLLAFDPGKTTGWAVMDMKTGGVVSGEDDFNTFCWRMEAWLSVWKSDVAVVGERFTITMQTAKNTQAPWSLEVIGVVRWLCERWGVGELELQSPSDAKKLVPNEIIHKLGWWERGTKGHDKDALRHLAVFAFKQGWRHPAFIPR